MEGNKRNKGRRNERKMEGDISDVFCYNLLRKTKINV